ncbi:MAG: hypothetical protein ACK4MM_07200 [Fervidobacterium sp.]
MNLEPPYKPIIQKPYCCVPACISMILDRRKIKYGSQEEIGWDLGLIVPKQKAHLFHKTRTGKRPVAGYGTRVGKKKYSINNFFKKNKINLKETYYPIDKIKIVNKFISENLSKNNDIIVCFNNKKLYGTGDYGHVSLIQSINDEIVTLVDPEKDAPKRRKVKLSKLIEAIKYHGIKNRGGFWVISKQTHYNQ